MEYKVNLTSEKKLEPKSLDDFQCLIFQQKDGDVVISWEKYENLKICSI